MTLRNIILFAISISLIIPVCTIAQTRLATPLSLQAAPLPINLDSLVMLRVDFASGIGLEKVPGNQTIRIIAPDVLLILEQFSITEENVLPFIPGFNEADTTLYHADGYSYRAPNYSNSVKITMYVPSRKAELIEILSTTSPITNVIELRKSKPLD
jgi:hypothetical protein